MNIEIKIPGYGSGAQPVVNVTHPTSSQPVPIEYNVNVSDSSAETAARPLTSQTNRQGTYAAVPQPIINTSQTKNVVTSTSMRTRERDVPVTPLGLKDQTVYHGYYTTPVTVTSSKSPNPQHFVTRNPQQGNPQMSLVQYDNRSFQATMDLSQYSPQEVQVRVKDRTVTVTANHREANHQGGFTQRSYSRQYTLPDDVNPNMVKCFISERGELSVEAPRMQALTTHDRIVPIEMRSPHQHQPPPPPPPPLQHIKPLQTTRTDFPPPPPPPAPPVETIPKRPPRPANYAQPIIVNTKQPSQRTPTVSFRTDTNDIDSGKPPRPAQPEVANERQTPFVEDVTSDVETLKIDFKSARKMFEN